MFFVFNVIATILANLIDNVLGLAGQGVYGPVNILYASGGPCPRAGFGSRSAALLALSPPKTHRTTPPRCIPLRHRT